VQIGLSEGSKIARFVNLTEGICIEDGPNDEFLAAHANGAQML